MWKKKRCNSSEVFNEQLEKCTSSQSPSSLSKNCKSNEYYSQTKKCESCPNGKVNRNGVCVNQLEPIKHFKMVNV